MATVLCSPCYLRGDHTPATNLGAVRSYPVGVLQPMCDSCSDEAGQAALERDFSAYQGGSSWGDSAQVERAKRDGAMR